jgi:alcohol dehydrogenase
MSKLIQGENSIQQIAAEISGAGYDSVFLISGKHFQPEINSGFLPGISTNHYIKSAANVEEVETEKAFRQFSKRINQAIVAIGGGSVIDLAKAVIHRCIESSLPVPFFTAIPTTAGSGSEATHFAVVYKQKRKYSLVHPGLLPQLVILDPSLTYSLPAYQTAVSGIDAFSQAVESFWNLNSTEESKEYAHESILLWKNFFIKTVNQPDPQVREKMLLASHLAGKAINITRTTGPHALSYYLTAHHHIPHGQAVALFLPVFFLFNKPGKELCSLLSVKNELEAKEMIQQVLQQAGLAVNFAELGLNKESILDGLLDEVNEERFANNPAAFDREELKRLIKEHL